MLTSLSVISLDQGKIWEERPSRDDVPEERQTAAVIERGQPGRFWLALLRTLGRRVGA